MGTICLEKAEAKVHQANEPIIPTSPSKVLSLFTLNTLENHTVYKDGLV